MDPLGFYLDSVLNTSTRARLCNMRSNFPGPLCLDSWTGAHQAAIIKARGVRVTVREPGGLHDKIPRSPSTWQFARLLLSLRPHPRQPIRTTSFRLGPDYLFTRVVLRFQPEVSLRAEVKPGAGPTAGVAGPLRTLAPTTPRC